MTEESRGQQLTVGDGTNDAILIGLRWIISTSASTRGPSGRTIVPYSPNLAGSSPS